LSVYAHSGLSANQVNPTGLNPAVCKEEDRISGVKASSHFTKFIL